MRCVQDGPAKDPGGEGAEGICEEASGAGFDAPADVPCLDATDDDAGAGGIEVTDEKRFECYEDLLRYLEIHMRMKVA